MTDIASLAIQLTANPQGFEAGLSSAEQKVIGFASQVANSMQNVEQSMNALKNNPAGAFAMALMMAVSALGAVKDGVANVGAELAHLRAEGEQAAVVQAQLTRRYGLTAAAAGGLAHEARSLGVDTGDLNNSLRAFSVRLGEAAENGGATEKALNEIGLSSRELASVPLDQALGRIGDALNTVENTGRRNTLRFEILGRRAAELEPILSQGTAGLARYADQAQRWGLVFSEADAKAVRSAHSPPREADAAMGSLRQGLANSIAVAAAPVLEFASQVKKSFAELMQGPLGFVRDVILAIGHTIADMIEAFKAGWQSVAMNETLASLKEVWQELKKAFGEGDQLKTVLTQVATVVGTILAHVVRGLVRAFVGLVKLIELAVKGIDLLRGGVDAVVRTARGAAGALTELFGGGRAAEASTGFSASELALMERAKAKGFASAAASTSNYQQSQDALAASIAKTTYELNQQTAAIGMNASQTRILAAEEQARVRIGMLQIQARLARNLGQNALADQAEFQIAQVTVELQKLRVAGQINDMMRERQRILEDTKTPLEKLQEQIDQVNNLFRAGMLTQEQYGRAVGRVTEQFARQGEHTTQLASGLAAGSAQVISAMNQASVQSSNDPQERIRAAIERQRAVQEQQLFFNRRTVELIQSGEFSRVIGI